ncbi:MAG: aminomethyl-transferring glycine dehydrogenase subunit GcvPB [Candidatus Omnitrophica bacterium]|nr:aminomethyl-transferring glycine dehydrogenase subunit GcvPB [Candidatus Omnitrophota bacterium]
MKLIFEKSVSGRQGFKLPESDVAVQTKIADKYLRQADATLPEVSELDVVRHFTQLSQMNFSVDANLYPLGSCTMKYNPKYTEKVAAMPGFCDLHPLLPQLKGGERYVQGALEVLYDSERWLSEITGMKAFTMQPLAGAHGELTGIMLMAAYHKAKGNKKKYIIIPDSAHGTNPASAAVAGYQIISVASDKKGGMDIEKLKAVLTDEVAGLMMTCPDTHGVFNSQVSEIAKLIHSVDGIMYYDGANLNATMGRCRPGDIGFDVVHVNLHKTFGTPHGGGGPGSGPVGVGEKLERFLPISRIVKRNDGMLVLDYNYPDSIGYIASFYGNFGIILRAYAYMILLGSDGLKATSDHAVLNANYVAARLKKYYQLAFDRICMHECLFSALKQTERGVHAIDIAKYLIDQRIHPPTVYFPLTVKEAIMIEPTETESKETMDVFIEAMVEADALSRSNPELFHDLPKTMPISRPDETRAAREMNVNFFALKA